MKNEQLITIESTDLTQINGGGTVEVGGQVAVAGRGVTGQGNVRVSNTNYEACISAARRTANEAYHDTRNFWGWLTGQPDHNAVRRANYEREAIRACGTPPQG